MASRGWSKSAACWTPGVAGTKIAVASPPLQPFRKRGVHRLIPSKFSEGGTVLADVADDESMLADMMLLDGATNDRIQGEHHGLSGITPFELVYGIPNAHIVRAAYLHPNPFGSRFNDASRGAWYAAIKLETSLAEVIWHRGEHLGEIVVPELPDERPDHELSEYDDWQADFNTAFHSLEPLEAYEDCLQHGPVPQCYVIPQALARKLLSDRSNGIIYPSVRHAGGTCVVCFRPALVYNPRRTGRYQIELRMAGGAYRSSIRRVKFD
ncbi:RES domain-containing protein [Granulicella aggregans]|uniref:RES domain-containing protein n=1 Tax=Granulicella aggregans TaxID=474949 RepID=A0A7W8E4U7_9BACT|nr:RES domain-containing protein [Granulicella aggregans]